METHFCDEPKIIIILLIEEDGAKEETSGTETKDE